MAQLHNHAAIWKPPANLSKRRFDYDGLFKDDAGAGLKHSKVWPILPKSYLEPYEIIAQKAKLIMNEMGKNQDVYGLIHGDCGVDANVLFWKGKAHIIDFDGSGFGYYMYDLALALEHCWEEKAYPQFLDALLGGYCEYRQVPSHHLKHLDLFRAAFYVYMGLWTIALDQTHPNSPNKSARHKKWLEYGMRFIKMYLATH
jgi:Ser/Thr protein kinase RdoA (MazF antagonist)